MAKDEKDQNPGPAPSEEDQEAQNRLNEERAGSVPDGDGGGDGNEGVVSLKDHPELDADEGGNVYASGDEGTSADVDRSGQAPGAGDPKTAKTTGGIGTGTPTTSARDDGGSLLGQARGTENSDS